MGADAHQTGALMLAQQASGGLPREQEMIEYAAGPAKQFFRFAISSAHTPRQLLALCEVIR